MPKYCLRIGKKNPIGLLGNLSKMEYLFFRFGYIVLINDLNIVKIIVRAYNYPNKQEKCILSVEVRFNTVSPYDHIGPTLKLKFERDSGHILFYKSQIS